MAEATTMGVSLLEQYFFKVYGLAFYYKEKLLFIYTLACLHHHRVTDPILFNGTESITNSIHLNIIPGLFTENPVMLAAMSVLSQVDSRMGDLEGVSHTGNRDP